MKAAHFTFAFVVTCLTSGLAIGQDLDLNALQSEPPAGWGVSGESEPGPTSSSGAPVFGYQFQYGTFTVQPGSPPTVDGMFALKQQQFPQGSVEKLYHEQMTYVGSTPDGAVFEYTINGSTRYVEFGTSNQGSQSGVPLRRIRYYKANGQRTLNTLARFYSP